MLQESDKIKGRAHITPEDVVKGNPRLNFAYVIRTMSLVGIEQRVSSVSSPICSTRIQRWIFPLNRCPTQAL